MTQLTSFFRIVRSLAHILSSRPEVPRSLQDNAALKVILERRSVRSFTHQPIPDDVFRGILEAARLAPSTVNLQTWSFITYTQDEWQEVFGASIPFKAPRAVIVVGDTHRVRLALDAFPASPVLEYTIAVMNASLAAMNMNLAAEALGVSSVMLSETGRSGLLDAGFLKEKLCLPEHTVPLMTIVFGYPKKAAPPMPPKLSLETICFSKQYHETSQTILKDWLDQTRDGYQASYGAPFESQLHVYQKKTMNAEKELREILEGDDALP